MVASVTVPSRKAAKVGPKVARKITAILLSFLRSAANLPLPS
jgi:hypothetical protein